MGRSMTARRRAIRESPPTALTTAVSSLLHAGLAKLGCIDNYYSLPWERIADMYGGVNRSSYVPGSDGSSVMYWIYTLAVGELTRRIR